MKPTASWYPDGYVYFSRVGIAFRVAVRRNLRTVAVLSKSGNLGLVFAVGKLLLESANSRKISCSIRSRFTRHTSTRNRNEDEIFEIGAKFESSVEKIIQGKLSTLRCVERFFSRSMSEQKFSTLFQFEDVLVIFEKKKKYIYIYIYVA